MEPEEDENADPAGRSSAFVQMICVDLITGGTVSSCEMRCVLLSRRYSYGTLVAHMQRHQARQARAFATEGCSSSSSGGGGGGHRAKRTRVAELIRGGAY